MQWLHERVWVLLALMTMLCFAVSNFLSGAIGHEARAPTDAGLSNSQVQMLVNGGFGACLALFLRVRQTDPFGTDRQAMAAQFAAGIVLALGNLALASALSTNFRMGPYITGMLPLNAVFLTVACHLLLKETTKLLQLIAIAISITGLLLMATADLSSDGATGIMYGLITALCYAIGNFGIKYASIRGLAHVPAVSLLLLGLGCTGLGFFAIQSLRTQECFAGLDETNGQWGGNQTTSRLHWLSLMSGFMQMMAICFMKLSVSIGPAAPAMAIANSNAIGVLGLNAYFFNTSTDAQQLTGLLICIGGVAMLSVVPQDTKVEHITLPDESHESDGNVSEPVAALCNSDQLQLLNEATNSSAIYLND